MKKKVSSIFAAIGLSFALATSVFAAPAFTDIGGSYAKTEIQALANAGIINGYQDNTFKPTQEITREEFAKMLCLAMDLKESPADCNKFTDVSSWARGYVGALVKWGITKGKTETSFGAKDKLTREQMATFFVRAMGIEEEVQLLYHIGSFESTFNDEAQIDSYAKANVALSQTIGFIKGDGKNFNPDRNADRQAVARLIYELVFNFDSTYAPKWIKLSSSQIEDVIYNKNGSYTITFVNSAGLNSSKKTVTKEEIMGEHVNVYLRYIEFLNGCYTKEDWMDLYKKESIIIGMIYTWQFEYSGVTVHPDYRFILPSAMEYGEVDQSYDPVANNEAITKGIEKMKAAINAFFAKPENANAILDEDTLISIGYECGVLVK